jgi:hypothetical protein
MLRYWVADFASKRQGKDLAREENIREQLAGPGCNDSAITGQTKPVFGLVQCLQDYLYGKNASALQVTCVVQHSA